MALIIHLILHGYSKEIRDIMIYMGGDIDCSVFIS